MPKTSRFAIQIKWYGDIKVFVCISKDFNWHWARSYER